MATDYYEILGVAPDTDLRVIKDRYRRLVRENHPDVAADKALAHERMQLILTAWNVLSDPGLRARYDLSRREALGRNAPQQTVSEHSPSSSQRSDSPAKPAPNPYYTAPKNPADAEVDAKKRARAQQAMRGAAAPPRAGNARTRLLTMVFEAAQLYHVEGRADEAIRVCNHVMKTDPTNAEAIVLLGDIYAEQNRNDVALAMYERAVRLQPNNLLYRQKWDKLRHGEAPPEQPSAARAGAENPWAKTKRKSLSERLSDAPQQEERNDSTSTATTEKAGLQSDVQTDEPVQAASEAGVAETTSEPVAAGAEAADKARLLDRLKMRWKR